MYMYQQVNLGARILETVANRDVTWRLVHRLLSGHLRAADSGSECC